MSDVRVWVELTGESSGWAAANGGEVSRDTDSVGCPGRRGSRLVWAMSDAVLSFSGGFVGLLAKPESRGLLEGVDGPGRPSQRSDRFEDGDAVGVDTAVTEAGFI